MIRYIEGKVIESGVNFLTILTSGGLGYRVYSLVDICISSKENESIELCTYHHIREDIESLFGFKNKIDLNMFELLISVSGLGPKSALTLLSSNNINLIVNAIKNKKPELLNKAPGLGKKTIEKMILELNDKVNEFDTTEINNNQNELRMALSSLGYNSKDIDDAIKSMDKETLDNNSDLNVLLREAFKFL